MKKIISILMIAVSGIVFAAPEYDESPTALFSTSSNKKVTMKINWITTANPQATCNAEAKKRGYQNFGFTVSACGFWLDDTCTIVTGKDTSMHTVGHEIRHCFQGDWHTDNGQKNK